MKTLILIFLLAVQVSFGQNKLSPDIRLNQIGFYPNAKKIAVVVNDIAADFYIASPDLKKKYFSGKLSDQKTSPYSPKKTRIADFTSWKVPGTFVVVVPGVGHSHVFDIKKGVHHSVAKASLKSFYFQRFSIPLTEELAGKWKRAAGPSHKQIEVHPSAATQARPAGTIIASPGGWIDAGDYNKYIVNSGISTSTILSAYEDFSSFYDTLRLNIPESKNQIPDILDEALWNLRWMLTMQDPDDGGVYHKCTNAKFDGMVMLDQATTTRYVVQKGTAAALNFAAVTAQASRILKRYQSQLPGLADSCLRASVRAWNWAQQNPDVEYNQNKLNEAFDPDIVTGAYGDKTFTDEFMWAAAELSSATNDLKYLKTVDLVADNALPVPSWNQVKALAYYTLLKNPRPLDNALVTELKNRLVQAADDLIAGVESRSYNTVMGGSAKDFVWGSSAVAANQGILLLYAYRLTKNEAYANHALANLDYLLGRNATGYSFVTGYGDKTPMHIHHRPSEADGIIEPVPGLLAGGPNPGMQDKCTYASSIPDEAYVDDVCSYASNEVAINWNAPLVYLTGALEALQLELGHTK
ncbi:MAG TPA: glycoside hydrolase family 9 protein [Chryseosolibacter sp.]